MTSNPSGIALTRRHIVTLDQRYRLTLRDIATGAVLYGLQDIDNDGFRLSETHLAICKVDKIRALDLASGASVLDVDNVNASRGIALTPTHLATCDSTGILTLREIKTGNILFKEERIDARGGFALTNTHLATSDGFKLTLREIKTGNILFRDERIGASGGFALTDTHLATGSGGTVVLRDVRNEDIVAEFEPKGTVTGIILTDKHLAWSIPGKFLTLKEIGTDKVMADGLDVFRGYTLNPHFLVALDERDRPYVLDLETGEPVTRENLSACIQSHIRTSTSETPDEDKLLEVVDTSWSSRLKVGDKIDSKAASANFDMSATNAGAVREFCVTARSYKGDIYLVPTVNLNERGYWYSTDTGALYVAIETFKKEGPGGMTRLLETIAATLQQEDAWAVNRAGSVLAGVKTSASENSPQDLSVEALQANSALREFLKNRRFRKYPNIQKDRFNGDVIIRFTAHAHDVAVLGQELVDILSRLYPHIAATHRRPADYSPDPSFQDYVWEVRIKTRTSASEEGYRDFGLGVDQYNIDLRDLMARARNAKIENAEEVSARSLFAMQHIRDGLSAAEGGLKICIIPGWIDEFKELYRVKLRQTGLPEHEREGIIAKVVVQNILNHPFSNNGSDTIYIDDLFYRIMMKSDDSDYLFSSMVKHEYRHITGPRLTEEEALDRPSLYDFYSIDNIRRAIKMRTEFVSLTSGPMLGLNADIARMAIDGDKKAVLVAGVLRGSVGIEDLTIPVDLPLAARLLSSPSSAPEAEITDLSTSAAEAVQITEISLQGDTRVAKFSDSTEVEYKNCAEFAAGMDRALRKRHLYFRICRELPETTVELRYNAGNAAIPETGIFPMDIEPANRKLLMDTMNTALREAREIPIGAVQIQDTRSGFRVIMFGELTANDLFDDAKEFADNMNYWFRDTGLTFKTDEDNPEVAYAFYELDGQRRTAILHPMTADPDTLTSSIRGSLKALGIPSSATSAAEAIDELNRFGIEVVKGELKFDKVPAGAPWVMDDIRNIERKPIARSLETMSDVKLIYSLADYEALPAISKEGLHSTGVYIGLIDWEGEMRPAAIKMFKSNEMEHKMLNELKLAQVLSCLGIYPRFYGVLRNEAGVIIGYAIQLGIGELPLETTISASHPLLAEVMNRLLSVGLFITPNCLFTRVGKLIVIDAGSFMIYDPESEEQYVAFIKTCGEVEGTRPPVSTSASESEWESADASAARRDLYRHLVLSVHDALTFFVDNSAVFRAGNVSVNQAYNRKRGPDVVKEIAARLGQALHPSRVPSELLGETGRLADRDLAVRGAVWDLLQAVPVPAEGRTVTYFVPSQLYAVNRSLWERIQGFMNARVGRKAYLIRELELPDPSLIGIEDPDILMRTINNQLKDTTRESSVLYLPDDLVERLGESNLSGLSSRATLVSYGHVLVKKAIWAEGLIAYGEGLRNIRRSSMDDDIRNYGLILHELYKMITGDDMPIMEFTDNLTDIYSDPLNFLRTLVIDFPTISPQLQQWLIDYQKDRLGEIMVELAV